MARDHREEILVVVGLWCLGFLHPGFCNLCMSSSHRRESVTDKASCSIAKKNKSFQCHFRNFVAFDMVMVDLDFTATWCSYSSDLVRMLQPHNFPCHLWKANKNLAYFRMERRLKGTLLRYGTQTILVSLCFGSIFFSMERTLYWRSL